MASTAPLTEGGTTVTWTSLTATIRHANSNRAKEKLSQNNVVIIQTRIEGMREKEGQRNRGFKGGAKLSSALHSDECISRTVDGIEVVQKQDVIYTQREKR